eukprot:933809_1
MILHYYHGLDNDEEKVPKDVTHVIVDDSVTAIKDRAFFKCKQLVSFIMGDTCTCSVTVIEKEAFFMCEQLVSITMGDSVKKIEAYAFQRCEHLRFIRLSKTLEYIGYGAFSSCKSLEVLILPSTMEEIHDHLFSYCERLRILILPETIEYDNVGREIIAFSALDRIAQDVGGVSYHYLDVDVDENEPASMESNGEVNEWFLSYMDEYPFHKLCSSVNVNTQQINDYLHDNDNGSHSAVQIDPYHGMTPLHMLAVNPHAPADTLTGTLLFHGSGNANTIHMDTVFVEDNQGNTPIDYARQYNVPGLLKMVEMLCMNRMNNTSGIVNANVDANAIDSKQQQGDVIIRKRKLSDADT